MLPRTHDFQNELLNILSLAQEIGAFCIGIRSGDLHKRLGGYPGHSHRMPVCCQVMKRNMKSGDLVLKQPPSGMGANLIICYKLPR